LPTLGVCSCVLPGRGGGGLRRAEAPARHGRRRLPGKPPPSAEQCRIQEMQQWIDLCD